MGGMSRKVQKISAQFPFVWDTPQELARENLKNFRQYYWTTFKKYLLKFDVNSFAGNLYGIFGKILFAKFSSYISFKSEICWKNLKKIWRYFGKVFSVGK